jgi:hypothetical protein
VVKGLRRVWLTNLPPSVSRLARENVGASTSQKPMGLTEIGLYFFTLMYEACGSRDGGEELYLLEYDDL